MANAVPAPTPVTIPIEGSDDVFAVRIIRMTVTQ
jgi:hypothetical protein